MNYLIQDEICGGCGMPYPKCTCSGIEEFLAEEVEEE